MTRKKHIKFDEENLRTNDAYFSEFRPKKIDEPKTPYCRRDGYLDSSISLSDEDGY